MMAVLNTQPQLLTNNQYAKVKSITPSEKDIIKNVFGNNPEIPQTIYNRIQKNLDKGINTNAILKIKMSDGSSYWTNNRFEPSKNNQFKNKFSVKTELLNKEKTTIAKKLYSKLTKLEKHLTLRQTDKFLEGYLEEKCISFNELNSISK